MPALRCAVRGAIHDSRHRASARQLNHGLEIPLLALEARAALDALEFRSVSEPCGTSTRGVPDQVRGAIGSIEQAQPGKFEHSFVEAGGNELCISVEGPPCNLLIGYRCSDDSGICEQESSSGDQHPCHFAEELSAVAKMKNHVQ